MRKISLLLPAICLALTPFTATADTLEYNSGGPTGPYNMTLDGSSTPIFLFCLNDNDFISPTETWNVNVIVGTSLSTFFSGPTLTQYEEEAYIYSQFNGSSNNTAVQDALWKIFDPGRNITGDSAGVTLFNNAELDYSTVNLANVDFYIYSGGVPLNLTSNDTATPQNFIGIAPLSTTPTPEPSTLVMLGTGLAALAGAARRKMVRG